MDARAQGRPWSLDLAGLRIPAEEGAAPGACPRTPAADPAGLPRDYCPDDDAFARLASELAFAAIPVPSAPAETGGMQGFQLELVVPIAGVDARADHWRRGVRGDGARDPDALAEPPRVLTWPRLVLRKGLPFGLRLDAEFGVWTGSGAVSATGGLLWAPFEAVDVGTPRWPDLAVRGSVTRLIGEPQLALLAGTVGAVVSEPFVLPRSGIELVPYLGTDLSWWRGRSGVVDLTPEVDALSECLPDPGQPGLVCTLDPDTPLPGGRRVGQDLRNDARFTTARGRRWRLTGGVRVGWRSLFLRGAAAVDMLPPGGGRGVTTPEDLPRQWSMELGVGVRSR